MKMKNLMKTYQQTIDELIFREYSKGTKLEPFMKATRLNIHDLAQILAGSEYTFMSLSKMKDVVPAEHQLMFVYSIQPTTYFDIEFSNMIREYHLDKDYKYFNFWMEDYYENIEKTSNRHFKAYYDNIERKSNKLLKNTKNGYEFKGTKKDIQIPKPGETIYNIGYYKNNPITIDEMIKTNWKYAFYIIKTFDNSPYESLFFYIFLKLRDMNSSGVIDVDLTTCIPIEILKKKYNETYKK